MLYSRVCLSCTRAVFSGFRTVVDTAVHMRRSRRGAPAPRSTVQGPGLLSIQSNQTKPPTKSPIPNQTDKRYAMPDRTCTCQIARTVSLTLLRGHRCTTTDHRIVRLYRHQQGLSVPEKGWQQSKQRDREIVKRGVGRRG